MYGNAKKYFITAKNDVSAKELLTANLPASKNIDDIFFAEGAWLNKARVTDPNHKVISGETMLVYDCHTQGKEYDIQKSDIVFEDENILVLYKPYGITSVADRSNTKYNLTYGARKYQKSIGNTFHIATINRLDFMVQGLVVFAKNREAEKMMFTLMQERKVGKVYLALTEPQKNPIKCFRAKDKIGFIRKAVEDENGRAAHSLFIYKNSCETGDIYSVITFTGRRHQIRFHAGKYISPLIGDGFYGARKKTINQVIGLVAYGYNIPYKGKILRLRFDDALDRLQEIRY